MNEEFLQYMLDKLVKAGKNYGMKIIIDKTKVVMKKEEIIFEHCSK